MASHSHFALKTDIPDAECQDTHSSAQEPTCCLHRDHINIYTQRSIQVHKSPITAVVAHESNEGPDHPHSLRYCTRILHHDCSWLWLSIMQHIIRDLE